MISFLHLYQDLFGQPVQAAPACLEEPELHQISQIQAGRAKVNVNWHSLTNGTAATTPGTRGDLTPKREAAPTPTSCSPVILVVSMLTLLSLNTLQKLLT